MKLLKNIVDFFKKNLIALIILLAFLCALGIKQIFHKKEVPVNSIKNITKLQKDTTKHYQDQQGKEHANRTVVTDPNRDAVLSLYQDSIHKLAAQINIKDNQINQFGQINLSTKQQIKVVVKYVDSSKEKISILGGDQYVKINGIIYPKLGTSVINYNSLDTLKYIFYTEHQNLLQKLFYTPKQYFDVNSANPNSHISNISSVIIPPPAQSRLHFSFYGGFGLQLNNSKITAGPQIGIGLGYKF